MDKLASKSFFQILGGLVVVGMTVEVMNNFSHTAAIILVVTILVSIMVVNPGTTASLVGAITDVRTFLFGG